MAEDTIKMRDKRTSKRYFVDNVITDDYGPIIGVYGIAVYNVLVRHSNGDTGRDSWPSHKTVARKVDCSVTKVKEVIKHLAELNLIAINHRYGKESERLSNEYLILDPPEIPPGGYVADPLPRGVEVAIKNPPSFKNPPPPPQKQAEEEQPSVQEPEYLDLDDDGFPVKARHPLVNYIMQNAKRNLTNNQQGNLAKGVPIHNPRYPSPCTLYESEPHFEQYIDEKIAWATGGIDGKRKTTGNLITAIRNYDNEHFGWLNFKQGLEEEALNAPPAMRTPEEAAMREEMPTEVPMPVIPGFSEPPDAEALRQELERQKEE